MESGGVPGPKKSKYANRGTRPVSALEYEKALNAFLAEPTLAAVKGALGCGDDVARSLVYEGLPGLGLKGLEARRKEESRLVASTQRRVQAVVEKSGAQVATQLETVAKEAAAAAVARQQAILGDGAAQLVEEARLVKANRDGAQALAMTNARLLRVADTLAGAMEKKLGLAVEAATKNGEVDPDVFFEKADLTMMQGLGIIRTIANVGQRIAESSKQSVEMARLLSGDPTSIVRVEGASQQEMSPEQAEGWLQRAASAWNRMQERKKAVDAILVEQAQENGGREAEEAARGELDALEDEEA